MSVKIRLRKQGRVNRPFFRLVVADSRSPRDGKYVEMVGWYDPMREENGVDVNAERVRYWLSVGAQMSENAELLVGKVAPQVLNEYRAKCEAKRLKVCAKRRSKKA